MSSLELEARPSEAGWVRRYVTSALCAWRLAPETIQAAEAVVGEMTANAIQAAGPSTEQRCLGQDADAQEVAALVTVTLRLLPGRVVIEVADDDPRPPVLAKASPDAECGRGLVIVDALAERWGFRHAPDGGKVTFAVLVIAAAGERQSGASR